MFMGGVERADLVGCYYSCRTKCSKFYKYIFHFLLDVSIILQKHYYRDSPHITILEFRSSWQKSSKVIIAAGKDQVVVQV